jgi:hypothetical protein
MTPPRPFGKKKPKKPPEDLPSIPTTTSFSSPHLSRPPPLPPPPDFSQDIVSRPPFPEPPSSPQTSLKERENEPVPDDLTIDILDELRQTGFGSDLQHTPAEKAPVRTENEMIRDRYIAAKEDYLTAGNKHLELSFIENAAVNYSCAALCSLMGEDVFQAAHLISELASFLPSSIVNSHIFQGIRLLLKAVLLKNPSFHVQAEKWLLQISERLYKEDVDLIQRALRHSKTELNLNPNIAR